MITLSEKSYASDGPMPSLTEHLLVASSFRKVGSLWKFIDCQSSAVPAGIGQEFIHSSGHVLGLDAELESAWLSNGKGKT